MGSGGGGRDRRRYTLACGVGILAALPLLVWTVSLETWDLFQTSFFGDFYDAQARALFHGHWYVPADVVQVEGFVVRGHTYMYFGPFPALLRMPVLLLTSRLDGRLTEVSILLAVLVALVCAGRLAWKVRGLVSSAPVSWTETAVVAFSVAVLGTGSVFLFLASQAVIYNEAEAWGAALAIAALDALVGFLLRPSTRRVVGVGVLVGLDLLTRGSVALGPLAAVVALAALHGVAWYRRPGGAQRPGRPPDRLAWIGIPDATTSPTRALALAAAAVVGLAAYAAVNEMKFGSLFSVPFTAQVFASQNRALRQALRANGGSLLGLKFVPTALLQYLRPDALRPSKLFPFVQFPPPATVIGNVRYASRSMASSVTATMPALTVATGVGLWATFRPQARGRHGTRPHPGSGSRPGPAALAVLRVPLAGAALGVVSAVAYAYIIERYLADWMPLLVLGSAVGLVVTVERCRTMRRRGRWTVVVVGVVLALAGVAANLALALANEGELTPSNPISAKARFVSLQQRVDHGLYGDPPPGVRVVHRLPPAEPAGSIAILGDCAALYQSDGTGWDAVERSGAGGHFRLAVTFPAIAGAADTYWPLLVTGRPGAGDYVAVRPAGHDEVVFAYQFQDAGARWYTGAPVHVAPGRRSVIDIVVDANTGQENVTLDGGDVFDLLWFARSPADVAVGADRIGGPTASTFPGPVRRLGIATPLCRQLQRELHPAARSSG